MFGEKSEKQKMFRKALLERRPKPVNRRVTDIQKIPFVWDYLVLWSIFFGITIYVVFFSSWLLLTNIQLEGDSAIEKSQLEAYVSSQVDGNVFRIFPKRNYLLISSMQIENALKIQYPKFSSVQVEKVFPNKLIVQYFEYPTLLRWCSGGPCYILSADSIVQSAERTELLEYEHNRLSLIDQSATPVLIGQTLSVENFLRVFQELFQALPEMFEIEIEQNAETPSRYASEIRLHTKEGWDLLVSTERSSQESLDTLQALFSSESLGKERRKELLLLDLRTEGRVFIIWKNRLQEKNEITSLEDSQKKSK